MGLSLFAYCLLAISGLWITYTRQVRKPRPLWLRPLHYTIGGIMVGLVLLLLGIGLVGTLGYYGNLGHSAHLPAGLTVVGLVLLSAWSATQISPKQAWARSLHVSLNILLLVSFALVSLTGWDVVQKYLP
jgi:hypothetical protein